MVLNAAIDAALGALPIVGDVFDFAWKSNDWNLALLERHAIPGAKATAADWAFVAMCTIAIALCALVPIFVFIWLVRRVPLV
jgi:hypothetical protein